jgi:hypothetical protein
MAAARSDAHMQAFMACLKCSALGPYRYSSSFKAIDAMRAVLTFITLFTACSLPAQLSEADTARLGGRAGLTGSWLSGNVQRFLAIANVEGVINRDSWALRSSQTWQQGSFGGFPTERDLFSRNFFYLRPRARVYPYAMLWVETNLRRDLQLRIQSGAGISAAIVRKPRAQLKTSLTLTAEMARFGSNQYTDSAYNGSSTLRLLRGTLRVFGRTQPLKASRCMLRVEAWVQPALADPGNYRLHTDAALDWPLTGRASLRAALNYNRESVVPRGVKPADAFLTFGFVMGNM